MKNYFDQTPEERKTVAKKIGKETTWPKAGIIFCENRQIWCGGVDVKTGNCKEEQCILDNSKEVEKIKKQRERLEKGPIILKEEKQPFYQQKKSGKSRTDILVEEIENKKEEIRRYYYYAKPKKAEALEFEVMQLERKLKDER